MRWALYFYPMIATITDSDTLDKILAVVLALFIMSVITEKITTLIRKYPKHFQILSFFSSGYLFIVAFNSFLCVQRFEYILIAILAFVFTGFAANSILLNSLIPRMDKKGKISRDLGTGIVSINPLKNIAHSIKDVSEGEKEQEVTLLSFLVGLGVAFAFKADMMAMFKENAEIDYGVWKVPLLKNTWQFNTKLVFDTATFVGILTSGFFLSFGSRFFHDLIDTILQTKNLKRKLNSKEASEIKDVKELDEFIEMNDLDKTRMAIDQNRGVLMAKFPSILFLSETLGTVQGRQTAVAAIYLEGNQPAGLPAFLPVTLPSGRKSKVLTEIVADVGAGRISGGISGEIANEDSSSYTGSVCCKVMNGNGATLLLTNCHVMTEGNVRSVFDSPDGPKVLCDGDEIGTWIYGSIDPAGDFALVELADAQDFDNNHPGLTFSSSLRDIIPSDYLKTKVRVKGSRSDRQGYVIDSVKNDIVIQYNHAISVKFNEAILLGSIPDKQNCVPVSEFHDSGGAVYDEGNKLIGIITGLNNKYTIVIPVSAFIKTKNLKVL